MTNVIDGRRNLRFEKQQSTVLSVKTEKKGLRCDGKRNTEGLSGHRSNSVCLQPSLNGGRVT